MPVINAKDLERAVKDGDIANVYYLYGNDFYTVDRYRKALVGKIVSKEEETYNLHEFQGGKDFDVVAFSDVCDALPMFAERVCVTVCDLDLNAHALGEERTKILLDTIKSIPDTTTVIFYSSGTDVLDGKKKFEAKNKNKRIADAVAKVGVVCEFAQKTRADTVKEIITRFEKLGCAADRQAAELICDRCNCELLLIVNEVSKIAAFTDGKRVTVEMAAMLTPNNPDTKAYTLADAVAAGDSERAMDIFNELIDMKNDPVYLLYIITGSMNDMYRAKTAMERGKGVADIMEDFSYMRNLEFRVKNAFSSARRIPLPKLRRCMRILAETDARFKSASLGDSRKILLEEAIIKMLSI